MLNRISRDLENLDEDWDSIDFYIYKIIKEIIKNNVNIKNRKKNFLKNDENENLEDKMMNRLSIFKLLDELNDNKILKILNKNRIYNESNNSVNFSLFLYEFILYYEELCAHFDIC